MKRKHKRHSRPKKLFDKARIGEEKNIVEEFGLKNKKEIWKVEAKIKVIREKAKKLIKSPHEEQKKLFNQLKKIGLNVDSIADVLVLDKKNYLERRLQTIVAKRKIAPTIKSARQMIVHKKISVAGKTVDRPSYIVSVEEENKIAARIKKSSEKSQKVEKTGKTEENEEK